MFHKKTKQDSTRTRQSGQQPKVYTYHSSRSAQHNPGHAVRSNLENNSTRTKLRLPPLKYLPLTMSLIAIILSSLYTTTLSTTPRIDFDTTTNTGVLRPTSEYLSAAEVILSSSIVNMSKITINTDEVGSKLEQQFPELSDVVVSLPLIGRRPIISIVPATPAIILESNSGGSFIVDTQGRALIPADTISADSLLDTLPRVKDQAGLEASVGAQLLPRDFVAFISQLHSSLSGKGYVITGIDLPVTVNEVHVYAQDTNYFIKFNSELDVLQQVGTYIALSESLNRQGTQVNEYIDVRVAERAFYR